MRRFSNHVSPFMTPSGWYLLSLVDFSLVSVWWFITWQVPIAQSLFSIIILDKIRWVLCTLVSPIKFDLELICFSLLYNKLAVLYFVSFKQLVDTLSREEGAFGSDLIVWLIIVKSPNGKTWLDVGQVLSSFLFKHLLLCKFHGIWRWVWEQAFDWQWQWSQSKTQGCSWWKTDFGFSIEA